MWLRVGVLLATFASADSRRGRREPAEVVRHPEHKAIAIKMHDEWCMQGDHWTTYGPCMRHKVITDSRGDTESPDIKAKMKAIDDKLPIEKGEIQLREMHDWWCARAEAQEAADGSALKVFCDGWAAHKQKQEL